MLLLCCYSNNSNIIAQCKHLRLLYMLLCCYYEAITVCQSHIIYSNVWFRISDYKYPFNKKTTRFPKQVSQKILGISYKEIKTNE